MFEIKVITQFAAAHQLKLVQSKCENLHGHNWKVEVSVCGNRLNSAGVLIDFSVLKKYIKELVEQLDHRFLNELPMFESLPPSSEHIAEYIAKTLQSTLTPEDINVSHVTVWESDTACATYIIQHQRTARDTLYF
ncbi:MAG: 6-carboxytetrahydropterin synthase QueD [Desulfobacterales bacterium]|nr:6-carboxytetrahydropterin synthase QueD [Desulfobacterales bacterium]